MLAPEGRRILVPLLITAFGVGILAHYYDYLGLSILYLVLGGLFLFCLNFFRDPTRIVPVNPKAIISPADGKVVKISKVDDPDVGEQATLVSIFLNVFNVHTNRMPVTATIKSVDHKIGKFLAAFNHLASDENERVTIIMESEFGTFKVKQIAGLIARRIICYAEPGKEMQKGGRLGYIMFGSRTDLILPAQVNVQVQVGQKVTGTETIIGEIS